MALILSGTDGLSDVDGSAATPAIRGTDANTGIFFPAADTIGFAEGGTEVARFNADAQFVAAAGTASLPVITTTGDTNTGIFFPAADTIAFSEGGVESMRIDSSGNVGIGTSSPVNVSNYKTLTLNGTNGGQIAFQVNGTTNGYLYNTSTAPFVFYGAVTEFARFDTSGNLLVGKTSANGTSGVGSFIQPDGRVNVVTSQTTNGYSTYELYSTGAGAYRFYVGAAGTVFATNTTITAISDQRLKENIRDLDDGLQKVMALQPRKFDWKEGKGADIKDARGFIAQEFEIVFPDMVEEWKDPAPEGEEPYKAVNANLIPTLVKAIQEQQAIITQLQADVEALKGQP